MRGEYLGSDMTMLLMSAFQQTGEGIAIVDLSGTLLFLNPAFARMHGYTEDDLVGTNLSVFHNSEQMTAVNAANRQAIETGSFSGEIMHLHRDGTVFPTLMHSSLVRDNKGQPIGLVGTMREISDIKRSMEDLKNARLMYESVLDAIPDVIGIQDTTHSIIQYNEAGYRFLGRPSGETNGKKCYELIGHSEPCEKCATSETYATHKPARVVKYIPEMKKWLDVRSYPILSESGELVRVIEHLRDMTQVKEAEARSRKLDEQIRVTQKLESLGVLAGGIAHDFNNILMAILGNADLALQESDCPGNVSAFLREILDAVRRAADLAGQMLDYSGRTKPSRIPVDINRIINETGQMLKVSVSKKTVLKYDLADELPMVFGDSTQLRQVIMNIIINGSEALANNTGTVSLSTFVTRCSRAYLAGAYLDDDLPEGDYVAVSITDTGSGMDSATVSRIFDPFFTTKFTGRGLGLAAVLGVIRSHRGAVIVTSEPGRGSVFTVLLPVYRGTGEDQRATKLHEGQRFAGCILMVDDEETVRAVAGRMLEKLGFTVIFGSNGEEAIHLFEKNRHRISCIVLDLTMPVMDGSEAFRRIIEIDPKAHVIISSGFACDSVLEQFSGEPLAGILHKPYSIDDLLLAIRKAVSGR